MDQADLVEAAVDGDHRALATLDDVLDGLVAAKNWAAVNEILDPLAAAAAGSPAAMTALLTMIDNHRLAHGPIMTILLDQAQIEDAVQDTLTIVARRIGSFEGRSRFTTWLYPVAKNAARQVLRSEQRHRTIDSELPELDPALRRLSSVVTDRGVLEQAIAELPDPFREVVELREIHHLTYLEIGEHLGLEVGTVKSRLNRGKAMARQRLGGQRT
ncbi:MAG: sigma-70 family RNA polymerase sigma factor [Actinomycetota bacterium]